MSDKVLVPVDFCKKLIAAIRETNSELHEATGERYPDFESAVDDFETMIEAAPEPVSAEPVATVLGGDPFDEREGLRLSADDWERVGKLPAGTKLYAGSAPRHEPFGYVFEKVGRRAPDDCEEYLEFVELRDVNADELQEYQKHGRVIALYEHQPKQEQWIKFNYDNPPEDGVYWLEVEYPEWDVDVDDYGKTVGKPTGETIKAVFLGRVDMFDDNPDGEPDVYHVIEDVNGELKPDVDWVILRYAKPQPPQE